MSCTSPLLRSCDRTSLFAIRESISDILRGDDDSVSRGIEESEERKIVGDAVRSLPERERAIICLRFGMCGRREHTQKEVAELLGISQSYISRLEKRIIDELHVAIAPKL